MNHTQQLDPLMVGALVLLTLAAVGTVVAFGAGARAAHRATQHAREVTRMGGNLTRALVTGAVIVGVQWAVVTATTDPRAWGVVFGVPALFAGSAIARMFAVTEIVHGSGHGSKRARR